MPTQKELSQLYETSWSSPKQHKAETGGTNSSLAKEYARKLACSLGIQHFGTVKILDFGAGRGAMAMALKALGAEITALEPFGSDFLRKQGLRVFRDLSEIPEDERWDGIVTIDVIEHLLEPWETLKGLSELLSENGWIYLATGNPEGLNARILRGRWREFRKRGHLVFPTAATMKRIFIDIGFSEWNV